MRRVIVGKLRKKKERQRQMKRCNYSGQGGKESQKE